MENQPPTKRGREEAVPACSMELEDRLSQLPLPILQNHILSLLPQNDAVRTCMLSKSWRHLGTTLPKFEFHEGSFPGKKQEFMSVVENTLQGYDNQNLPIQEFILELSKSDTESIKKWIPRVVMNMGVKTFKLRANNFSLPAVVFQAESLTELYLEDCKLNRINNGIVNLQMLKRLVLRCVCIEDETFEKIMSSCPSIQHIDLYYCGGLSNIKVNKSRNLKHLVCHIIDSVEINEETPSLETIRIVGRHYCEQGWYHVHKNNVFPRLKSLDLRLVHLPTESLNSLSSNSCPCLEELQLHSCSGFTEFKLSNRSIKRLIIRIYEHPIEVIDIDAANLLYFEYRSSNLPSISFAVTSREWKSSIDTCYSYTDSLSAWYLKLYEFLKALSQSQISLASSYFPPLMNQDTGGSCEPVGVEHLCFKRYYSPDAAPDSLNCMFRICRPRYIGLSSQPKPQKIYDNESQLAKFIWKTLVNKGECDFWQQDLEESSIQVTDENTNEWRVVQEVEFSNNEEIRFRLKWR